VTRSREFDVVVQMGHVARTRGATGTSDRRARGDGWRGSEQDFARQIGPRVKVRLEAAGLSVALIGADDDSPTAEVFVALHQDGSGLVNSHGASVGYPVHGDGGVLAKMWKARYTLLGWPFGFNPDNFTTGLHWYYGFGGLRRWWWKRAKYDAAFLIEHGFATTPSEEDWMWDRLDQIAGVDADSILQYLGKLDTTPPTQFTGDAMIYFFAAGFLTFYWIDTAGVWSALTTGSAQKLISAGHPSVDMVSDAAGNPSAIANGLRLRLASYRRLDESTAEWTSEMTAKAGLLPPFGNTVIGSASAAAVDPKIADVLLSISTRLTVIEKTLSTADAATPRSFTGTIKMGENR